MWKTKSAGDLSLPWLILYSFGLVLSAVYLVYIEAMAAWIPMIAELSLTLLTLALKLYLDAAYPNKAPVAIASGGGDIERGMENASVHTRPPSFPYFLRRVVSLAMATEWFRSSKCPHCQNNLKLRMFQSPSERWGASVYAESAAPLSAEPTCTRIETPMVNIALRQDRLNKITKNY